uniref:Arrestin C-terminal-like domain-containing protein n=1 Tax=Chromera velia CCMP2878 TaxID=1169474 RepID=A0A0G4GZD3_9ALVE|eukprot:Cvel_5450.t1-p1 / transcript=Cvel_5450.t1 / gene=Cvel_5450 / organism=Chromera_velia_CCMP2878 / gene_product=Arrestin domain-containing protein A, putative / transcript_product=Arrestin domain-containing protein A, putative / location=Cvel_scaffold254:78991-80487(+) / protein_length=499 / sequence_SO=supercontig / SO=protein_coding / is_pseudo=false
MGTSHSIYVRTDKPSYSPGETVRGELFLKLMSPIDTSGVFVKVTGYERVKIEETVERQHGERTERETHVRHGRSDIFKMKVPIWNVRGGLAPGDYTIPFTFVLPQGIPGTLSVRDRADFGKHVEADICYKIKGLCERPGWFKSDIKHRQYFQVMQIPPAVSSALIGEGSQSVNVCCCFGKGHMNLKIFTERSVYTMGEAATVICEVENHSTVEASSRVALQHILTVRANGIERVHTSAVNHHPVGHVPHHTSMHHHMSHTANCTNQVSYITGPNVAPGAKLQGNSALRVQLPIQNNSGRYSYSSWDHWGAPGGGFAPSAIGNLIQSSYRVVFQMSVTCAPSLVVDVPVTISYASPQPQDWSSQIPQAPPGWSPQAMPAVVIEIPVPTAPPTLFPEQQWSSQASPPFHKHQAPPAVPISGRQVQPHAGMHEPFIPHNPHDAQPYPQQYQPYPPPQQQGAYYPQQQQQPPFASDPHGQAAPPFAPAGQAQGQAAPPFGPSY